MKKSKHLLITTICVVIVLFGLLFNSCKQDRQLLQEEKIGTNNIKPNVVDCGEGFHWDFTLHQCVPNCSTGYIYCPTLGYCVPSNQGCVSKDTIVIIRNSGNPYDNLGGSHNGGCDFILPKISFTSSTVFEDLLYQDKIYMNSIGYDSSYVTQTYYGGSLTGYLYNPDSTYTNNPFQLISKLKSEGQIANTAQSYFNNIFNYLNNDIGNNVPSSSTYNMFANDLVTLETQINIDYSLSENERMILLSACAIARYSAGYWGNYYLNENTGNTGSIASIALFGIRINWKKVIGADVTGAIGGFFSSIFTGGGVVAGTIAGAVGSSVGEAVLENTNLD